MVVDAILLTCPNQHQAHLGESWDIIQSDLQMMVIARLGGWVCNHVSKRLCSWRARLSKESEDFMVVPLLVMVISAAGSNYLPKPRFKVDVQNEAASSLR